MGEMARKQNKTTKMLKSGAKKLRNTETNILKKKPKQTKHSRRVDGEIIIKEITEKSISWLKKDKVLSVEGLTDGSRIVANRSTLKHRQGALLSPEEKEKNTLQAVDGKSGLFSKERTLLFFKNFELILYFFPKAKNFIVIF